MELPNALNTRFESELARINRAVSLLSIVEKFLTSLPSAGLELSSRGKLTEPPDDKGGELGYRNSAAGIGNQRPWDNNTDIEF